jgi:two-component system chemotaxis response regulator CheY
MHLITSLIKDRSVVIADDDDITREMLRGVLRAAGLCVIGEASEGMRAMDLYRKLKPDVVCLDIDMPLMSGLEALKQIRANDHGTIVLMITGIATGDNVRGAIEARADGIIVKPFNTAKIVSAIDRAIAQRKAGAPKAENSAAPQEATQSS